MFLYAISVVRYFNKSNFLISFAEFDQNSKLSLSHGTWLKYHEYESPVNIHC